MIDRMITQQAYTMSANDLFYLTAMIFVLLIGVIWLARPVKNIPGTLIVAGD